MESVYAGSVLTISAADAENSNEGFLNSRSPLRYQSCRLDSDDSTTLLVEPYTSHCMSLNDEPGMTNLDQRGWVLQERLLSPRTLYFGHENLHWECREGFVCENNPSFKAEEFSHGHYNYVNHKSLYLKVREAPLSTLDIKEDENLALMLWGNVMRAYSRMTLSWQEDKLAALAGIARSFQPRLGMEASFGVSVSNLGSFIFDILSHCLL